jgi:hypothetical protein
MDLREALALEKAFWRADASFCSKNMADDFLMISDDPAEPGTQDQVVAASGSPPRWVSLIIEEARLLRLTAEAIALSYRARARRESGTAWHHVRASSVYVRRGEAWQLFLHQETPVPPPSGGA